MEVFNIPHIDDVRNGLLLFKPIEWAFDNSLLVLVPNGIDISAFLVDPELEHVTLMSKFREVTSKVGLDLDDQVALACCLSHYLLVTL